MARRKFSGRTGKKRTFSSPGGGKKERRGGRTPASGRPQLAEQILALLYASPEPLSAREILAELGLGRSLRKELQETLAEQLRAGTLAADGEFFRPADTRNLAEGRLEVNPKGFGFAVLAGTENATRDNRNDPFVPPGAMGTALHGDLALFLLSDSGRGRREARVIRVLDRRTTSIAGVFTAGRDTGMVTPEDERYIFTILVHRKDYRGARNGEMVLVELTDYPDFRRNPTGRIVEVLGDPNDMAVQTRLVIRKFALPDEFSEEALAQAKGFAGEITPEEGRLDLRQIPHVTIDGETARDFDDAVAVESTSEDFRLYVSIADVGHYVKLNSDIDKEAYARGTSVYFPNMVLPMLPERLSNDLCSLNPLVDRYAFTAVLDFDRQGARTGKFFSKSLIRSHNRFTYTEVRRVLVDREAAARKQFKKFIPQLEAMQELAAALEQRRMARGAIGFNLPEPELILNDDSTIQAIVRAERNAAHKIIEEFMLAANEAVAATFTETGRAALYRIHEEPDTAKVAEFVEFAGGLGINSRKETGTPPWFGDILAQVEGTPREYIVNNLLLRTMQRARYAPKNVGHFGLAASDYVHFTSPIRRYPDLQVHRALENLLRDQAAGGKRPQLVTTPAALPEAGDFLSERERVAVDAERELTARLQVRFMAERVGEEFDGIISGVTAFGLFVELIDHFISGAVPIEDMEDDVYQHDPKRHRLIGQNTMAVRQMGDGVRVRVVRVDIPRRHIDFALVPEWTAGDSQS